MVEELEVVEAQQVELDDDADVIDAHLIYVNLIGDWMLLVLEEMLVERADEDELDD